MVDFKISLDKIVSPNIKDGSVLVCDRESNTIRASKVFIPKQEEEEGENQFFKVYGNPLGGNFIEYLVYDNSTKEAKYSNIVLGSGGGSGGVDLISPQTITGEKRFNILKLNNPTVDTTTSNNILTLDTNNQIKKSALLVSDLDPTNYITTNTSQIITGTKIFNDSCLYLNSSPYANANRNLCVITDDAVLKSTYLIEDFVDINKTTQTITTQKIFSDLRLDTPIEDTTETNSILVIDSNNQIKKSDKLYSDIGSGGGGGGGVTLDTTQTITGEKSFDTLKLNSPVDDTATTNNILVLDSNNQIKKSDKLYSDLGSADLSASNALGLISGTGDVYCIGADYTLDADDITNSIILGNNNRIGSGNIPPSITSAVLIGRNHTVYSTTSIAIGLSNTCGNSSSIAIGAGVYALDNSTTAIGSGATASKPYCVSIGRNAGTFNNHSNVISLISGLNNPGGGAYFHTMEKCRLFINLMQDDTSNSSFINNATYDPYGLIVANGLGAYFDGDIHLTGSQTGPSDKKLKTNIQNIGYSLTHLLKLRPVQFNWKDPNKSQKKQLGLVAQEVEPVIPEVISDVNDTKSISYQSLIPILIKSIQELNATIEKCNKTIQTQGTKIEQLTSRIQKLETKK